MNSYRKTHVLIEFLLPFLCFWVVKLEDAFGIYAFGAATVYNLLYVLFLRKKAEEKFLESIANIILIWAFIVCVAVVFLLISSFFFGYTDYDFVGNETGRHYYGFDAWKNSLGIIILIPFGVINGLYIAVYFVAKKYITKRKKMSDLE